MWVDYGHITGLWDPQCSVLRCCRFLVIMFMLEARWEGGVHADMQAMCDDVSKQTFKEVVSTRNWDTCPKHHHQWQFGYIIFSWPPVNEDLIFSFDKCSSINLFSIVWMCEQVFEDAFSNHCKVFSNIANHRLHVWLQVTGRSHTAFLIPQCRMVSQ